jgi:hypothetical protein
VIEELYGEDVAMLRVEVTYSMQNGTTFTLPAITRTRIRGDKIVEYLIFVDPSPAEAASKGACYNRYRCVWWSASYRARTAGKRSAMRSAGSFTRDSPPN